MQSEVKIEINRELQTNPSPPSQSTKPRKVNQTLQETDPEEFLQTPPPNPNPPTKARQQSSIKPSLSFKKDKESNPLSENRKVSFRSKNLEIEASEPKDLILSGVAVAMTDSKNDPKALNDLKINQAPLDVPPPIPATVKPERRGRIMSFLGESFIRKNVEEPKKRDRKSFLIGKISGPIKEIPTTKMEEKIELLKRSVVELIKDNQELRSLLKGERSDRHDLNLKGLERI